MILAAYCLALAGLAGLAAWCAATRWWHYLVMAVACGFLYRNFRRNNWL